MIESLAKNKSNFCPPRNRNITLDNYIDFLTKFPLEELRGKDIKRSNLTKEEQNALQELRGLPEILIFEADKGGAVGQSKDGQSGFLGQHTSNSGP